MRPITVTVGPNATTPLGSTLVRLDDWALPNVSIQVNVTGTVNYTVQSSLDDPNDPTNPVALASMTWISSSDSNAVGATAAIQTNYFFVPRFVRVLLNSGSGSVTMTVLQSGVVSV